jgi:coenzyme F420-dependent glucose-6-phosphate dehydrogenase
MPRLSSMIGYHASHEQFPPGELLEWTVAAERAGFEHAMCSDHFAPWSASQGESGFAWSWLGAALARTSLSFGTVNAPGQRYHPAIVAQAAATLEAMFPGRFWIALGSGQLLNEGITGARWPSKQERNARLLESATIVRDLFRGETVSHDGMVTVRDAKLWSRPARSPRLFAAALTPETAEWAAHWADGLITISAPRPELRRVVDAWRRGGGERKPMFLQVKLSYASSHDEAIEGAFDAWRYAIAASSVLANLPDPQSIEAAAAHVTRDDVAERVRVSSNLDEHARWLAEDVEMGFSRLFLHNVNRAQERFIRDFGERVLPRFATKETR